MCGADERLSAEEGQEAEGTGSVDSLEVMGEGGHGVLAAFMIPDLAPVLREDREPRTTSIYPYNKDI